MTRQTEDPEQSWSRLTLVGGVLAALVGLLALVGWAVGSEALKTFAPGRIPMAPSTAVLFLLFGILVAIDGWRERALDRSWALALAGAGTFASVLLFLLSLAGVQAPVEHLWLDIAGAVDGVPVGHISPATAAAFMLAGASYLLLTASWGPGRARLAFVLSALLEGVAVILVAGYLMSQPVLYGSGFIPPAPNTSIGFVLLGVALLGTATRRIWGDRTPAEPQPGSAFGLSAVLVVSIALVLTPAVLLFRQQQAEFETETHAQLQAIAELKVGQIGEWREERLSDIATLSANPVFAELAAAALYRGEDGATQGVTDWFESFRSAYGYAQVTLVDSTGAARIAVRDTGSFAARLSTEPDIELASLRAGHPGAGSFHRHSPSGTPHFSVAAPIFRADAFLGAVVLWMDPDTFLYPALTRWPVPSRTAETLLVRRDGDDVLFLNDLRFRDDAALRLRIPLSNTTLPAARAILGEEGIVEGRDYRDEPVVAAIRSIPGTDWKLVARIDAAEVYGPIRTRLQWTLALIAGLLVGIVAIIGLIWQRREKLHYRREAQTEGRHHTLLDSIGDAVISTDIDGRVEVINPVAQRLTGWPREEAVGQPLEEVFRIVNEETGAPVENPAAKVMRAGVVVGLANSTVLIARDGAERPIADSAAPVFDEDGAMTGVILVFRDQTRERAARRRLREEVERAQLYLDVAAVMIVELDEEGRVRLLNERGAQILGCGQTEVIGEDWFEGFIPADQRDEVRWVFERAMAGDVELAGQFENEVVTRTGEHRTIAWKNLVLRNDDGEVIGTVSSGEDITQQRRTAAELRRSEAKYRNLFDSIRDAILVTDMDREIVDWNPAFEQLFGYTPEEIRGSTTGVLYEDEEEYRRMGRELEGHIGDPGFNLTSRYRKKSGEVFPGETNAFYLRDDEGEIVGFIGLIKDVSVRKQAEQALAESEARYRTLFEDAPVGIFRTRSDGRALEVNPTMAAILGLGSPEEVTEHYTDLGRQLYADPARRDEFIERLDRTGRVGNFRYEAETADGHRIWLEMDARVAERHADGSFTIEGFAWDVTERREAELAIQSQQAMLERTERIAQIGSWEMDVATGEVRWSDELYRIFGRDPGGGAPPLGETGDLIAPEDLGRLRTAVGRAIEEAEPYDLEVRAVRQDGEIRWCRALGYPEQDAGGRVIKLYGAFADVTERREREHREDELRAQLSQAQKMEAVGRLAGGVAHDFNNMLSVILGHAELAMGALEPDTEILADLERIQQAARSSADLTRQLLAFAREQVAQPETLDLNDIVGSMLMMLRRLIGEDIELAWQPADDVWPVRVDPVQVDQVLANLLVNARDAIDGVGEITIHTASVTVDADYAGQNPDAQPGDYVVLSVTDTGPGIAPEVRERIFEPFFTTKEPGEGTGLGLATVYGIVRQNKGFITVYSEPGLGTTFKVYFPRTRGEVDRDRSGRRPDAGTVAGDETILVVEDQEAVLELVKKILSRLGYSILWADTPSRAIEIAREHDGPIDLLITDVIMPEMNGRDLADRLVSENPGLATLFMSGYAEDVIAQRGVIETGVHFLEKPFTAADLGARVREALEAD